MSARQPAAPVARRALQDEVYDAVLTMLLGGELPPGRPVGIDSLAMRLGVSQTPVREALARLEGTSLIERSAMRGYRVSAPMEATEVREYFDARVLVEVAAAKRAYANRADVVPPLAEQSAAHADLARALGRPPLVDASAVERAAPLRRYLEADLAFHRVIGAHCGNRYLRDMIERLGASRLHLTKLSEFSPADAARAADEHALICRAFAEGTREEAQDAVRRHVHAARDRALAHTHRGAGKQTRHDVAREAVVRKTGRHE